MPTATEIVTRRDANLSASAAGAEAQTIRPMIERLTATAQNAIVVKALSAREDKTLTPELALAFWLEFLAHRDVLARVDQQIAKGQSAGKALAPMMG